MQTNALGSQPGSAIRDRSGGLLADRCPLHLAESLPAERQRVFYALTVPEYMEAWLAIPGAPRGRAAVTKDKEGLSICCLGEDTDYTIQCTYRVCNRSKLLFDWKHHANFSTSSSLVTIRLMGEFERTNLELIHFGLKHSLHGWHRKFWEVSLAQLSRLF